jgi:hypothetical protein
MGFQVGQHAMKAGQEYMEQNVRGRTTLRTEGCGGFHCGGQQRLTDPAIVEPVHFSLRFEALLQRVKLLRGAETAARPVSLAA